MPEETRGLVAAQDARLWFSIWGYARWLCDGYLQKVPGSRQPSVPASGPEQRWDYVGDWLVA